MINNPILKGFNPDPSICRCGDDYYIACSSFEWMPAIPIYHSKDLKNWELYTNVITDDSVAKLKNLPSSMGIWAPCLTYNESEGLFYLVFGVTSAIHSGYCDVSNYVMTSRDIKEGWSEPVYLHSAGFDASLFHDTNGKKWLVSLMWETRDTYQKPGSICICEYDSENKKIVSMPKRIYNGATERGCLAAPHIYKHNGMYYLICAEGGTGYYHCVTSARSITPDGEYLPDPENPIITSSPENNDERYDTDIMKPQYFNPSAPLQKAGHGSLVETQYGEFYMAFSVARPFLPEKRCVLGRETAIQRMIFNDEGWLRAASGTNIVGAQTHESKMKECKVKPIPETDNFDDGIIADYYYSPRSMPSEFAEIRDGSLVIKGRAPLTSANCTSFLARKLTSVNTILTTKLIFNPEIYQHSAGIAIYYNNMNYVYLKKFYSEELSSPALMLTSVRNSVKTDYFDSRIKLSDRPIYLRLIVDGRNTHFEWSYDNIIFEKIGINFDTTMFSDEYSKYGRYTGTFVGVAAVDGMLHEKEAEFSFIDLASL